MSAPGELIALRAALRAYVADHAPDVVALCGAALAEDHPCRPLAPIHRPALALLPGLRGQTVPALQPVVDAVIAAAPLLAWRQTYRDEDPGIGADFLSRSGWFNLIAPSGPFVSDHLRLSVGLWDKGLHYPRHWHKPEEIYLTLAGSAIYHSEGREPFFGPPGATVHHLPDQPHAATMRDAPLLAAAFWVGEELEAASTLDGAETTGGMPLPVRVP